MSDYIVFFHYTTNIIRNSVTIFIAQLMLLRQTSQYTFFVDVQFSFFAVFNLIRFFLHQSMFVCLHTLIFLCFVFTFFRRNCRHRKDDMTMSSSIYVIYYLISHSRNWCHWIYSRKRLASSSCFLLCSLFSTELCGVNATQLTFFMEYVFAKKNFLWSMSAQNALRQKWERFILFFGVGSHGEN